MNSRQRRKIQRAQARGGTVWHPEKRVWRRYLCVVLERATMKPRPMIERPSKCPYCRHPRVEHVEGRGCQHKGCCCQEEGPSQLPPND